MDCLTIFQKAEELEKTYFKVWEEAATIESPSKFKEGVDKCGSYFAQLAEQKGWKVEYSRQEVSGDVVCITMNADSALPPLALSGHIDTVHPVGLFGYPPVHFDEEKIYGPGVSDCKGGVVAAVLAMDALSQCGYDKRPVMLLLQTDEEGGSLSSNLSTINYICEKAKAAVVFLNLESYAPGRATVSRKGIVSYEFEVTGKEGHSSRCVTEGANAIVDAAHKLIELDKFKDDEGITCNCAVVNGGSVVNTIPGKCKFSVNFRYATNQDFEYIEKFVHDLANTVHVPGCTCTVRIINERPAMECNQKNLDILARVNEIFEKNDIPTLKPMKLRGGSDASFVTKAQIPCMDSLGTIGGGSHSIREFACLESLVEAAKRIIAIAVEI